MRRFFGTANILLFLWLVGFAVWAWFRLPDEIPLHFGIDGLPDSWGERTLGSWFTLPVIAGGLHLLMQFFRILLPRHPNWVNLPDRTKLTDLPEAARGPVLEMFSGFLAMVQTEVLVIFSLIMYASFRSAMGESSQGIMILVLIMAILASPFLMVVFFLRLQSAMNRGREAARRASAGQSTSMGAAVVAFLLVGSCGFVGQAQAQAQLQAQLHTVTSPDGRIVVSLEMEEGAPFYRVERDGKPVIRPSHLGFEFRGAPLLGAGMAIVSSETESFDETWEQPWGEVRFIRNHYNQLRVELGEVEGPQPRRFNLTFRVFDDGVGFRYELPEQEGLTDFEITSEKTEFHLAGNHTAWWIPANTPDRYELLYRSSPVSTLDTVHTPLTMKAASGLHLAIHEAALTDYAAMNLTGTGTSRLGVELVPWADGVAVRGRTPFVTPWRTIQLGDEAGDLMTSYLVLNLNEPSRIEDTSWIRPMKYVGIWWEMHIGTATWESGARHGATTENARKYIDFAAQNGFHAVLIEGWNRGWDGEWSANGDLFSFTEPYPDFDLEAVTAYARDRGVEIIGHNETSMGILNYESQMEGAFSLYRDLGIRAVKTGYVGDLTPEGHGHHGQYMVRHFRKVIEAAARAGVMLNAHEPIKDTGIRRSWPNMMSREGARGQEYNAWGGDGGNPPEHTTILPFTRMLGAPMDFTPGIFALETSRIPPARVSTTLAKQLALYVVLYSPLQMAADLPESYEGQPAFQFIRDVPVDWAETRVLNGEIGEYLTVVRKDRNSAEWYLGAITDEDGRDLEISLDFLDPDQGYVAEIYADGPGADWESAPYDVEINKERVTWETVLNIRLAPGGGLAIRLRPILE